MTNKLTNGLITPAEVYQVAVMNGHYERNPTINYCLFKISEEVKEARNASENNIPEGQPHCLSEELADIVLVTFSMAEHLGIDIIAAINRKHERNKGE